MKKARIIVKDIIHKNVGNQFVPYTDKESLYALDCYFESPYVEVDARLSDEELIDDLKRMFRRNIDKFFDPIIELEFLESKQSDGRHLKIHSIV